MLIYHFFFDIFTLFPDFSRNFALIYRIYEYIYYFLNMVVQA